MIELKEFKGTAICGSHHAIFEAAWTSPVLSETVLQLVFYRKKEELYCTRFEEYHGWGSTTIQCLARCDAQAETDEPGQCHTEATSFWLPPLQSTYHLPILQLYTALQPRWLELQEYKDTVVWTWVMQGQQEDPLSVLKNYFKWMVIRETRWRDKVREDKQRSGKREKADKKESVLRGKRRLWTKVIQPSEQ